MMARVMQKLENQLVYVSLFADYWLGVYVNTLLYYNSLDKGRERTVIGLVVFRRI